METNLKYTNSPNTTSHIIYVVPTLILVIRVNVDHIKFQPTHTSLNYIYIYIYCGPRHIDCFSSKLSGWFSY